MRKKDENWTNEKVMEAMLAGGARLDRAFEGFFFLFHRMAFSLVNQFGLSKADFDDVMAEVFMSVARRLQGDPAFERASLSTYVFAAFRNKCINLQKAARKTVSIEELSNHPPSGDDPELKMLAKTVMEKVVSMGEPCKTILTMRGKGFEHTEIAETLNLSLQTIKNKTVDCRKALINLLGGKKLY